MLMRGDFQKLAQQLNDQLNPILEQIFKRLDTLEADNAKLVETLEKANAPKKRGRPPGSKNKPKD